MIDYIKFPTIPTQDLLREVEAVSPYPRITPQHSHPEDYKHYAADTPDARNDRASRRFVVLRRLISQLKKVALVSKVDLSTANDELFQFGLAILDHELSQQAILETFTEDGLASVQHLIKQKSPTFTLDGGDKIVENDTRLFPVSAVGLIEFRLSAVDFKISRRHLAPHVFSRINQDGFYIEQQDRLHLIFNQKNQTAGDAIGLNLSVLVAVMESDEEERRAILYPRGDQGYGLYADKLINFSI